MIIYSKERLFPITTNYMVLEYDGGYIYAHISDYEGLCKLRDDGFLEDFKREVRAPRNGISIRRFIEKVPEPFNQAAPLLQLVPEKNNFDTEEYFGIITVITSVIPLSSILNMEFRELAKKEFSDHIYKEYPMMFETFRTGCLRVSDTILGEEFIRRKDLVFLTAGQVLPSAAEVNAAVKEVALEEKPVRDTVAEMRRNEERIVQAIPEPVRNVKPTTPEVVKEEVAPDPKEDPFAEYLTVQNSEAADEVVAEVVGEAEDGDEEAETFNLVDLGEEVIEKLIIELEIEGKVVWNTEEDGSESILVLYGDPGPEATPERKKLTGTVNITETRRLNMGMTKEEYSDFMDQINAAYEERTRYDTSFIDTMNISEKEKERAKKEFLDAGGGVDAMIKIMDEFSDAHMQDVEVTKAEVASPGGSYGAQLVDTVFGGKNVHAAKFKF